MAGPIISRHGIRLTLIALILQISHACGGSSSRCGEGESCGCQGMDDVCLCLDCQLSGECHFVAGSAGLDTSCSPVSDADCQHPGGACEVYGECQRTTITSVATGAITALCHAVSDKDCKASTQCGYAGDCSLQSTYGGDMCGAAGSADCANSTICKRNGCCTAGYDLGWGNCYDSSGVCNE
jgi:hypothetical protein